MVVWQDDTRTVHRLVLNDIHTNAYLVQRGAEAVLIDPTDQADRILAELHRLGLHLRAMLATHGHFDHVAAAGDLVAAGVADALQLHPLELAEYKRAGTYAMVLARRRLVPAPVVPFRPALQALLADWGLALVHAGGHTRGSCWLHDVDGRFLITGDLALHHRLRTTLFDSREHRAEFAAFVDTVVGRFAPGTPLLPGHGDPSTVGDEARLNRKWQYVRERQAA